MTRKTSTDKDNGKTSKSEGRDYTKLKNMLEEFVEGGCKDYNEGIDDIIHDITLTGVVRMPWKLLKPLLRYKIDKILNESFEETGPDSVIELLERFNGPPFTIQRICELIKDPRKSYRRRDKYIHALQKNLLVVTTLEPDLIWMKVPNLSALLDPKSSPSIPMPTSSPDAINEKEPVMSRDLPSPSWKLPRSPISPRSPRSPRSRTPPPDFESSFAGRNWEGLLEPHPILFRKRTSSSGLRETHSVELHVQLQEADSTVPDQPLEDKQRKRKRHCSNSDSDEDILKAILGTPDPLSPEGETPQSKVCSDNKLINTSEEKKINTTSTSCESVDSSEKMESDDNITKEEGVVGEDAECSVGDQRDGETLTRQMEMETN